MSLPYEWKTYGNTLFDGRTYVEKHEALQLWGEYMDLVSETEKNHTLFFYKDPGKLGWSLICLRISQFEPEIMLDGMLNFKTHFMVWYCVWYEHCNGLFKMFKFEHSIEFEMNTAMFSVTFEIL